MCLCCNKYIMYWLWEIDEQRRLALYKEGTAYKVVVSWLFSSSQSSNGNVNNNTGRQTSKEPKQYILKGKEVLFSVKRHIPTPKAEPSKANVNRTEPEKGGYPRCCAPITAEQLKKIFPKTSEKTRIKIDSSVKCVDCF